MKKATIQLETLSCPSCLQKIESALEMHDGVNRETVKVMFNASRVRLEFDEDKTNIKDIEDSIQKPTLLEEIKIKGMSGSKITFHKDNKTINSNVDASSFKRSIESGRSNLYK